MTSLKRIFKKKLTKLIQLETKILKTCQCCKRHIINRPKSLEDPSWWVAASQEPHNTNKCELYGCACTCRQCSRQLVISGWKRDPLIDDNDGYFIVSDYEEWEF